MATINSKSLARIAAIQAMYQLSTPDNTNNLSKIKSQILDYYKSSNIYEDLDIEDSSTKIKVNHTLFNNLIDTTLANVDHIDRVIRENLDKEASFENLPENSKAILRLGATELIFMPDIPSVVVVSEYTNIASSMLKESEIGLVNSVLDSMKDSRKKE